MGITQKYNYESTVSDDSFNSINSELGHGEDFLFLLLFLQSYLYTVHLTQFKL